MLSEVSQMVADREAGTPGPWEVAEAGTYPDDEGAKVLGPTSANSRGNRVRYYVAQFCTRDASRIARLPDLEAAYLTLAAENATLRAELAAAEANINIKADWIDATINDMERVEKALETAKTRHIGDQPSYSSASDLGWAHQEYASLRRDIIAALTPTADRTEYERKVAQMKEDFPNGI